MTNSFSERLGQSALRGLISQGELLEGYLAAQASIAARRTANAAEQGNLSERMAAVEAELEALIFEPPAPAREPAVAKPLRSISEIIPFHQGGRRG